MLSFMTRRPIYFNKNLSDYCTRTTNESIRKITEKHNLERNKVKFKNPLEEDDDSEKPEFNFYHFMLFLSISYVTYFFYKRIK